MKKVSKIEKQSIITINSYENEAFIFTGNEVDSCDIAKIKAKQSFTTSYIKFKDILTITVEIQRSINESDVADLITIKTYEELNLSPEIDYKITYLESQSNSEEMRLFNVFIIEHKTIEKIFSGVVKKVRYLDYIALAPLLYESLYKKNLLSGLDVDCFISLQKDEAFLVIYQGGEYLTSRQLRYDLNYIKDKQSEQIGERIDEKQFYKMLSQYGVNISEDNIFTQTLSKVLDECVSYINDMIQSINRIYQINVNNIYIDTAVGIINKLDDYINKKININTKDLNASLAINTKNLIISQQHNIMKLLALSNKDSRNDDFNFSLFKRPLPLLQRQSGKIILVSLSVAALSAIYPIYNYSAGYYLTKNAEKQEKEYIIKQDEANQIKLNLDRISNEQNNTSKIIKSEESQLSFRRSLLEEIYNKKVNYTIKSLVLYELGQIVNKNKIKINALSVRDNNVTINLKSDNSDKITQFIKDVSEVPKFSIGTKEINYNDKNATSKYESNVSVEIIK